MLLPHLSLLPLCPSSIQGCPLPTLLIGAESRSGILPLPPSLTPRLGEISSPLLCFFLRCLKPYFLLVKPWIPGTMDLCHFAILLPPIISTLTPSWPPEQPLTPPLHLASRCPNPPLYRSHYILIGLMNMVTQ